MELQRFVVGRGVTNCYLVSCPETREAILVDPHFRDGEGKKILEIIEHNELKVKYLINTHGHYDHTSGNQLILEATDAQLLFHEGDYSMISEPWTRYKSPNGEGYRCPKCNNYSATLTLDEAMGKASLVCSNCKYSREFKFNRPDRLLAEGDRIIFGRQELTVLHTPGTAWAAYACTVKRTRFCSQGTHCSGEASAGQTFRELPTRRCWNP